jgi:hypothetical protein
VVEKLADAGMVRNRDYYLRNIGVGFTIPVNSANRLESELAAFTVESVAKLSSMDIALEVEDVLGDVYGRIIECLHTAHYSVKFKYGSSVKTGRFRKRRQR